MKKEMINDLEEELKIEFSKSPNNRDYGKISDILKTIYDISNDIDKSDELRYLNQKSDLINKTLSIKKEKNKRATKKIITMLFTCLFSVLALNLISIKTLGMNMFSAIYQLTKGGISINMNLEDEVELEKSSDDPYGIKAKCAEYGVTAIAPTYLLDGFYLSDFDTDINDISNNIYFFYKNGNMKLNYYVMSYIDEDSIPPTGFPTDSYNVTEEVINDITIYILMEDNQFTATFMYENTVYMMFTEFVNYDDSYKMIESLSN